MKNITLNNQKIVKLFELFNYFIFFGILYNYEVFIYLFAASYLYYYFLNRRKTRLELDSRFLKVAKLLPIIFYVSKFIFSLSQNLNFFWKNSSQAAYTSTARFIDAQQFFMGVRCNTVPNLSFEYIYKFTQINQQCPKPIGWGPLPELFRTSGDIWMISLIFSIIAGISFLLFYNFLFNSFNEKFLIVFLTLSPPVNFLFERMNADLFLFLITYYVLKNYQKRKIFNSFVLLLLFFIKLYPLGAIGGLILVGLKNRDFKTVIINCLTSIIAIYYVIFQHDFEETNFVNTPDLFRSFGLSTNFENLSYANSIFDFNILVVLLLIYSFLMIFSTFKLFDREILVSIKSEFVTIPFITLFVFIALYESYDYRLFIFIFLPTFFNKIENSNLLYFVITLLIFSPVSITGDYSFNIFEYLVLFLKLFSFHQLFLLFSLYILIYIKSIQSR